MDVKPRSLNTGEATCNLRVLTFVNAHHSVYSNKMPSILSQIFFSNQCFFNVGHLNRVVPVQSHMRITELSFLHQRALT